MEGVWRQNFSMTNATDMGPLFCCENFLPPVFGLKNFWATLSTIPMWLLPLSALQAAYRQRAPPSAMAWLLALFMTFLAGTIQHALGTELAGPVNPVVFGNVQNALLAGHLAGAPLPLSAALAAAPLAAAVS